MRQVIREDITRLQLLPTINKDEILLQLMALTTQVPQLSLATEDILGAKDEEKSVELSDNVDDWKANLAQTWQQFISDFITIRQHSANIEPLLSVEQQQNLLTNIKLKLQQAQWAVSHDKESVFRQTLLDIKLLITQYFSEESAINKAFVAIVESLAEQKIKVDYPSELSAFEAINQAIEKKLVSHIEVLDVSDSANNSIQPIPTEGVAIILPETPQVIVPLNDSETETISVESEADIPLQSLTSEGDKVLEQPEVKDAI